MVRDVSTRRQHAARASHSLVLVALLATLFALTRWGGGTAEAEPTAAVAPTCTVTWAGGVAGDWDVATNWTPARPPVVTDTVCTARGVSPTITVATPAGQRRIVQVAGVRLGSATLDLAALVLLRSRTTDLSATTVTGPGVLDGGRATFRSGTTSHVAGHVQGTPFQIGGRVVLDGSADIVTLGALDLSDGARVVDGSGAGSTRLLAFGDVVVTGDVRVGSVFGHLTTTSAGRVTVTAGARLTLDRPAALDGNAVWTDDAYTIAGTLVLPRPPSHLVNVALDIAATGRVLETATRTSALRSLAVLDHPGSDVVLAEDEVVDGALTVTNGARLTVTGSLTVPRVSATTSGTLDVGRGARVVGSVSLGRGAHLVTAAGDDDPPVVTGDLTSGHGSTTEITWPTAPTTRPGLRVTGSGGLGGTLMIHRTGPALPVGTAIPVLTLTAITGRYDSIVVDDPLGQTVALRYTASQVVATITGPPVE